jgi:ribosomal protein S27E
MFNKLPNIEVNEFDSLEQIPELAHMKLVCYDCGNQQALDKSMIEIEAFHVRFLKDGCTKCGKTRLKFSLDH